MKILLAVDGSDHSRNAIDALARFPLGQPPELILAHVCPVPDLHDLAGELTDQTHRIIDECRMQGRQMLQEAEARCRSWAKSVQLELLAGRPGRELVLCARQNHVDLVVTGAHGRSPVSRFLLGSVSDSLAKHAPCSVLVVRPRAASEAQRGLRILVADDGSPESERAVARLAQLPLPAGSEILLMHVVDTLQAYHIEYTLKSAPALTKLLSDCQQRIDQSAQRLRREGVQVSTHVEEGGAAADHLLKQTEKWKPDLIVIGSMGKVGWERMLLGSVSTRVLHHAACSVWIERAQQ